MVAVGIELHVALLETRVRRPAWATILVMRTVTPRRRLWKILATGTAVLLLPGLLGWRWIDSVAARRRTRMEEEVRRLHSETLARVDSRPPLHGEGLPGNAWTDYSLALAETWELRGESRNFNEFWYNRLPADRSRLKKVIQDHPAIFDHLQKGAKRGSGAFPFLWEAGMKVKVPYEDDTELLGYVVACAVRSQAEEGKGNEAVLKLLDLLQFARDLSANSTAECVRRATRLWTVATLELKDLIFSEKYPRQDLSGLDHALEVLDRHFPSGGPILLNQTLGVGFELLKPEHGFQIGWLAHRRYVFSSRIAEAEAFEMLLAAAREAAVKEDGPAAETRGHRGALFLPYRPLVNQLANEVFRSRGALRANRVILRLLRIAVHYRATGEILELEDPYGDKLHHGLVGEDLRVWSVGPDGIDHDGDDPGWDWSQRPPTPVPGRPPSRLMREPRDIVLQVER